jgi:hypothetical protein
MAFWYHRFSPLEPSQHLLYSSQVSSTCHLIVHQASSKVWPFGIIGSLHWNPLNISSTLIWFLHLLTFYIELLLFLYTSNLQLEVSTASSATRFCHNSTLENFSFSLFPTHISTCCKGYSLFLLFVGCNKGFSLFVPWESSAGESCIQKQPCLARPKGVLNYLYFPMFCLNSRRIT